MWFLQWRSHQPGGLGKFAHEFLLEFPERLRTAEMVSVGWPRSGRYSLEDCVRVWGQFPKYKRQPYRPYVPGSSPTQEEFERQCERIAEQARGVRRLSEMEYGQEARDSFIEMFEERSLRPLESRLDTPDDIKRCATDLAYLASGDFSELRKIEISRHPNAALLVESLTPEYFWTFCAKAALERLPYHLSELCTNIETSFNPAERWSKEVWYFDGLIVALIEMMDRHAARVRGSIASTSVSEMIMDRFDFAREMRGNVLLVGDARLGKSVSAETCCRMWPGRWRLVTVPQGNRRSDFIEAHAKAMNLVFAKRPTFSELEDAVKHVLRHGEFLIAYDEFHAAVPDNAEKDRAPWRLNWLRGNVVDRNLGVIFSATRQSYSQALKLFMKNTSWAIEQHAGRLHDTVSFGCDRDDMEASPVLSRRDVLNITAMKFPDIAEGVREQIAVAAYGTNTPPQSIDALAKAAKWKARKAGRTTPNTLDAQEAIADWQARTSHEDIEQGAPRANAIGNRQTSPTAPDVKVPAGHRKPSSRPAAALLPPSGSRGATTFPTGEDSAPSRLPSDRAELEIA